MAGRPFSACCACPCFQVTAAPSWGSTRWHCQEVLSYIGTQQKYFSKEVCRSSVEISWVIFIAVSAVIFYSSELSDCRARARKTIYSNQKDQFWSLTFNFLPTPSTYLQKYVVSQVGQVGNICQYFSPVTILHLVPAVSLSQPPLLPRCNCKGHSTVTWRTAKLLKGSPSFHLKRWTQGAELLYFSLTKSFNKVPPDF